MFKFGLTKPAPSIVFRFQRYHWLRHISVCTLFAILATILYIGSLKADFQFDDLPNISHPPAIRMKTFSWDALWLSAKQGMNNSRILVNTSFALQYWGAQFIAQEEGQPPGPAFVPWQFRLVNIYIHLFAGIALYLLILRLLQLPKLRGRFDRHAWALAVGISLVWFTSPLQIQAVTYVVQRATSMCALFFFVSILCYLEARQTIAGSAARNRWRAVLFFALSVLSCFAAVFSKQNGMTIFLALLLVEWLLIERSRAVALPMLLVLCFHACVVGACFVVWAYGYAPILQRGGKPETGVGKAMVRLYDELYTRLKKDKGGTVEKLKVSPRQRLITQARVVAMYQSLLLVPAPSRLNLDYDFRESTELFVANEYRHFAQWLPLLLVLGVITGTVLARADQRARIFLFLLAVLLAIDAGCMIFEIDFAGRLSRVWLLPWPMPAFVWHFSLLGFAALYSYRRPLMAFGIFFFYLGHLIESTVIPLELVFEHRLYLPSAGFYLTIILVAYEAFFPADSEQLDPPPVRWLAR